MQGTNKCITDRDNFWWVIISIHPQLTNQTILFKAYLVIEISISLVKVDLFLIVPKDDLKRTIFGEIIFYNITLLAVCYLVIGWTITLSIKPFGHNILLIIGGTSKCVNNIDKSHDCFYKVLIMFVHYIHKHVYTVTSLKNIYYTLSYFTYFRTYRSHMLSVRDIWLNVNFTTTSSSLFAKDKL